jgi:hypothetical protein
MRSARILRDFSVLPPALGRREVQGEADKATVVEAGRVAQIERSEYADRMRNRSDGAGFRSGLLAGGKEIRTLGPAAEERPFRRAPYGFFGGTYRASDLCR